MNINKKYLFIIIISIILFSLFLILQDENSISTNNITKKDLLNIRVMNFYKAYNNKRYWVLWDYFSTDFRINYDKEYFFLSKRLDYAFEILYKAYYTYGIKKIHINIKNIVINNGIAKVILNKLEFIKSGKEININNVEYIWVFENNNWYKKDGYSF